MSPTPDNKLVEHLDRDFGKGAYTISGASLLFASATMSESGLRRLLEVARAGDAKVSLSAGTITISPGRN